MKKLAKASLFMGLVTVLAVPTLINTEIGVQNTGNKFTIVKHRMSVEENQGKETRINWHGTAELKPRGWSNITSSNNLLPDSPRVTSGANNKSKVNLRVVDEDGNEIGEMKQVMPGKSVRLDQIPMLSGDYTIQGSAEIEGVYTFEIN